MRLSRTLADLIDEELHHHDLLVGVLAFVTIKQCDTESEVTLSKRALVRDIKWMQLGGASMRTRFHSAARGIINVQLLLEVGALLRQRELAMLMYDRGIRAICRCPVLLHLFGGLRSLALRLMLRHRARARR